MTAGMPNLANQLISLRLQECPNETNWKQQQQH